MGGVSFQHNTDIGQNFLRDRSVVEWMVNRASLGPDDRVLEVGPGQGVLTEGILSAACASLDAVELDIRLRGDLEAICRRDDRLTLHWGDAVAFDYGTLAHAPTHVIANLPYHITTPLIWRLLEAFSGRGLRYMLLMVQMEAAQRIASAAGVRESNPLGVTIAALGGARVPRRVSRGAFSPMPRVDSAIVEVEFSGARAALPSDKRWRRMLAGSFALRRKTLINNWHAAFGIEKACASEILAYHALPPLSRPEEISLEGWLDFYGDDVLGALVEKIK